MQIIKLLATSLLVFSLNVNLSANSINPFDEAYDDNTNTASEVVPIQLSSEPTIKVAKPTSKSAKIKVLKPSSGSKKYSPPNYGADLTAIANSTDKADNIDDTDHADNNAHRRYARSSGSGSSDTNLNSSALQSVENLKVNAFVKKLFFTTSLYLKWLTALEEAINNKNVVAGMESFLTDNDCDSCTYQEVIQAFEVKKSKNLVFWSGDYQTNLMSMDGTGRKLGVTMSKYLKVRFDRVIGVNFKIDGKSIFGATFKDRTLTWDYGTNMQLNDSKGSITFAEVILNGQFVGHQFTGTLIRHLETNEIVKPFVGFAAVGYNRQISYGNNQGGSNNHLQPGTGGGLNPGDRIGTGGGLNPIGGAGGDFNPADGANHDINPVTGKPQMSVGFIDYKAKRFGTYLWTTENMRHYPSNVGTGFWSSVDNEKEVMYYDWNGAMNGEIDEGAQGICADGWHIPTDTDWLELEDFLGMSDTAQAKNNTYRGTNQGTELKMGGTSGFNAQLLGYHAYGSIQNKGLSASFISSTSDDDKKFFNRHIGPFTKEPVRFIFLKQGSDKNEGWYFSEVEVMANGKNVALNKTVMISGMNYVTSAAYKKKFPEMVSKFYNVWDRFHLSDVVDGFPSTGTYSKVEQLDPVILSDYDPYLLMKPFTGWLKIDLGAEYDIDSVTIKKIQDVKSSWPAYVGNNISVFVSKNDINSNHTLNQLRYKDDGVQELGVTNNEATDQVFPMHKSTNKNTDKIWRGPTAKSMGYSVRCVKIVDDADLRHKPQEIILQVGKPMTPIGFNDTVSANHRNWFINPPIDNGLELDFNTGVLSGTPLVTKDTTDYYVWVSGDDLSTGIEIAITIVDDISLVSSIEIDGKSSLNIGESTSYSSVVSPSYANNKKVVWSIIGDNSLATITQAGVLTALKAGRIKILASADDNSAAYGTFAVILSDEGKDVMLNGKHYLVTRSSKTGRDWLDRNLGASQTCASTKDVACYGDLYQWGRSADGHQLTASKTKTKPEDSITPADAFFVTSSRDWTALGVDDSGGKRQLAWRSGGVNNVCPIGFNVPTMKEFMAEISTDNLPSWDDVIGITPSLKTVTSVIPLNGWRNKEGQLEFQGTQGNYWTQDNIKLPFKHSKLPSNNSKLPLGYAKLPLKDSVNSVILNQDTSASFSSRGGTYKSYFNERIIGMGIRCIKSNNSTASLPFISPNINSVKTTVGVPIASVGFSNVGGMVDRWEIEPELSAGLSFIASMGIILGTPSKAKSATYYRITAHNAHGIDSSWVRITVEPKPIAVTDIQLVSDKNRMTVGETFRTHLILRPSNVVNDTVWSSSNPSVAVVNEGVITAIRAGTAIIFARSKNNPRIFDSIKIIVSERYFNGKNYNTVTSPRTGRVWLDRNVGASRACNRSTDIECYGSLYQFGRVRDGHQKRLNSHFTTNQATSMTPGTDAFFLTGKDWINIDKSGNLRSASWDHKGSNNICPVGFVVPTLREWLDERIDADLVITKPFDVATTFSNFLKLPVAGWRSKEDGSLVSVGLFSNYWSRTPADDFQAHSLGLGANKKVLPKRVYRNQGLSVRCIAISDYKSSAHAQDPMEVSGVSYKTTMIDGQVWTTENMRHYINNSTKGVYSHYGNSGNDKVYGKYYTAAAAMKGDVDFTQGICASGWHVSTNEDWKVLEANLGMSETERKRSWAWRGTNQGDQLKQHGIANSGFNAVASGRVRINDFGFSFTPNSRDIYFWSADSRNIATAAAFRSFKKSSSQIYKGYSLDPELDALSVRCVKDSEAPMKVGGIEYKTVKIGEQMWTAENMRHKPTSGKFHSYTEEKFHAKENVSFLYDWEAVMNGSEVENAQGICASGWHVPSEYDWQILEGYLGMKKTEREKQWAWRGDNQGRALKRMGRSGFNASVHNAGIIDGHRLIKKGETSFWSSTKRTSNMRSSILFRVLRNSSSRIYKGSANMQMDKLSVRCIQD